MSYFSLANKSALITGGCGLLGVKHAEAILEFDGEVILADITSTKSRLEVVEKLKEKYKTNRVTSVYMDVTNKSSIQKAISNYTKIDILINNAAKDPKLDSLSHETKFETMTEEFWAEGIGTILNGTFLCSQIVINKMLSQGGGVVLNIASDLGVISPDQRIYDKENPKPITYSAAKWGVIGITKYLSTYFLGKDIRVNSLSPAGVFVDQPDDFVKKLSKLIPMGRMANVDEYKGAVVFMCSDASSYMNGENLVIDGGRSVW